MTLGESRILFFGGGGGGEGPGEYGGRVWGGVYPSLLIGRGLATEQCSLPIFFYFVGLEMRILVHSPWMVTSLGDPVDPPLHENNFQHYFMPHGCSGIGRNV